MTSIETNLRSDVELSTVNFADCVNQRVYKDKYTIIHIFSGDPENVLFGRGFLK